MDVLKSLKSLSEEEKFLFKTQFDHRKKNGTTAMLLSLFLGSFGMNFFYLGNLGLGILCILFFWTGIPFFIGIINSFFQFSVVKRYNYKLMDKIVLEIIDSRPSPEIMIKSLQFRKREFKN